jgi:hypothetical protein
MPTYRITISFDIDRPNVSQAQTVAEAVRGNAATSQGGQGAHTDVQVVNK